MKATQNYSLSDDRSGPTPNESGDLAERGRASEEVWSAIWSSDEPFSRSSFTICSSPRAEATWSALPYLLPCTLILAPLSGNAFTASSSPFFEASSSVSWFTITTGLVRVKEGQATARRPVRKHMLNIARIVATAAVEMTRIVTTSNKPSQ
jgi:hypothetical protein